MNVVLIKEHWYIFFSFPADPKIDLPSGSKTMTWSEVQALWSITALSTVVDWGKLRNYWRLEELDTRGLTGVLTPREYAEVDEADRSGMVRKKKEQTKRQGEGETQWQHQTQLKVVKVLI